MCMLGRPYSLLALGKFVCIYSMYCVRDVDYMTIAYKASFTNFNP